MQGASKISPYTSDLFLFYRLADGAVILGTLCLAMELRGLEVCDSYLLAGFFACAVFLITAGVRGLYRTWQAVSLWHEFNHLAACWATVVVAGLVVGFMFKATGTFSRIAMGTWFVAAPVALWGYRAIVRYALWVLRRRGVGTRKAVIAGAGMLGRRLAQVLTQAPWMGFRVMAFYDDAPKDPVSMAPGGSIPVAGTLDDLIRDAHGRSFDLVFITLPMRAERRIREIVDALGDTAVSVYFVPDFFVFDLIQSRATLVSGIPVLSVFESPFSLAVNRWLKRLEDMVLASTALIFLAVPMGLIAVGVKLSSPGPVLFRQKRHGFNGDEIEVWKFRTMTCCEDGKNAFRQATACDPRVTPFGRFLRRTSLDELPQLINVLQGRMSLVGPRPHAVAHNEQFRKIIPGYMRRHKVKPGITGLAQVNGWRGETDTLEKMQKRVEYDLEYLRSWSLWLDLKILFLTVFEVVRGRNAY